MHYFDTSFLVPLVLPEATSAAIERFVLRLPVGELTVSQLARIEFASLLARDVRSGGLSSDAARAADAQFELVIRETFTVLMPSVEDFDLARHYLSDHSSGLRAADALHLATAKNNNAGAIYSLDKTLLKAGKRFGLSMTTGIRISGYAK
ncbi:MAG: type II toxin-antitoxin system VapC family toxin [Alphaproteobacteria bacterium]|nr:type II toxin-antitoxin system VapC family toxin [Alphaproteobacteria bacterium]